MLDLAIVCMGQLFDKSGPDGTHGRNSQLKKYKSTWKQTKFPFLASQVTGAIYLLWKTIGTLTSTKAKQDYTNENITEDKNALEKTMGIPTFGGFLEDATGMGKTTTTLLFLSHYMLYHALHPDLEQRPTLLLLPSATMLPQWISNMKKYFPMLNLAITWGEKPFSSSKALKAYIKGDIVREEQAAANRWPKHFQYAWNRKDANTSSLVIVSTYST